jgi:hypothetical protein
VTIYIVVKKNTYKKNYIVTGSQTPVARFLYSNFQSSRLDNKLSIFLNLEVSKVEGKAKETVPSPINFVESRLPRLVGFCKT